MDHAEPPDATRDTVPDTDYEPHWNQWTRQLVTVILLIAVVYAFTLLRPVIQMLSMAFILAFLMAAPSRAITRRTPIPYGVTVVVFYLLLICIVVFLILVFIPAFITWVNGLVDSVEQGYVVFQDRLREYEPQYGIVDLYGVQVDFNFFIVPLRSFVLGASHESPPGAESGNEGAQSEGTQSEGAQGESAQSEGTPGENEPEGDLFGDEGLLGSLDLRELLNSLFSVATTVTVTLTSAITSVAGFTISLIMALFLSFLILLDLPRAEDAAARWIPPAYHREYALLVQEIVRVWNGFFRGQVTIGIIIGALTWVQLALMGVASAEILAVFTGAISLIPTIGGIAALVPMALVPLFQGSSVFTSMSSGVFALLVVGINLLMQQVIWNVVAPKILGEALDLPLPVIIVGVFIGAAVGGILGAFLVAPIMGTLRVILFYVFSKLGQRDPFPGQEAPAPYETFAEARPRIPPRRR